MNTETKSQSLVLLHLSSHAHPVPLALRQLCKSLSLTAFHPEALQPLPSMIPSSKKSHVLKRSGCREGRGWLAFVLGLQRNSKLPSLTLFNLKPPPIECGDKSILLDLIGTHLARAGEDNRDNLTKVTIVFVIRNRRTKMSTTAFNVCSNSGKRNNTRNI